MALQGKVYIWGDLEGDKVKKLKSSTTKPDEAGIKKVVQFAHEKLTWSM